MTVKNEASELETKKSAGRKATTAKTEIKKPAEKIQETVMYIGTSLTKLGLQQNTIFKNGVPKDIEKHIEKCPAIGALMVPISRLPEARSRLGMKGTAEHMLNQQIESYGGAM